MNREVARMIQGKMETRVGSQHALYYTGPRATIARRQETTRTKPPDKLTGCQAPTARSPVQLHTRVVQPPLPPFPLASLQAAPIRKRDSCNGAQDRERRRPTGRRHAARGPSYWLADAARVPRRGCLVVQLMPCRARFKVLWGRGGHQMRGFLRPGAEWSHHCAWCWADILQ